MRRIVPFRSVLIFGGAGFIGSNWAQHFLANTDANVHVFDNLSRAGVSHNLAALQRLAGVSNRLKVTIGDVRDAELVQRAVHSATEIYHFAAQVAVTTSIADPRTDFEVNVGGTLNILEAARKTGRRPFLLFTSTNKVYGHLDLSTASTRLRHVVTKSDCVRETQPLDFYSPYGCSKGAADQYVHDYARIFGIPTVVFRMSCIAGPGQFGNEDQGWVAHFLYSALQDKRISIYGDGRQVRDVLCIEDLMRAFEGVRAHSDTTAGQVYNLGGGLDNAISLLELIEEIQQLTGKKLRYRLQSARPGDQPVYVTDFSKLKTDIGWQPEINVHATLEKIYGWRLRNEELFSSKPMPTRLPALSLHHVPEVAS